MFGTKAKRIVLLVLSVLFMFSLATAVLAAEKTPIDFGKDKNKMHWYLLDFGTKDDSGYAIVRKYYTNPDEKTKTIDLIVREPEKYHVTALTARRNVKLLAEHPNIWSKLSCPERLSLTGPKALNGEQYAYTDVVPFARRLMQQFPDRVLFGTDWPHPNLKDHMPDDGLLVDYLAQIATTPQELQQILVDNPMRLYWPEEV